MVCVAPEDLTSHLVFVVDQLDPKSVRLDVGEDLAAPSRLAAGGIGSCNDIYCRSTLGAFK